MRSRYCSNVMPKRETSSRICAMIFSSSLSIKRRGTATVTFVRRASINLPRRTSRVRRSFSSVIPFLICVLSASAFSNAPIDFANSSVNSGTTSLPSSFLVARLLRTSSIVLSTSSSVAGTAVSCAMVVWSSFHALSIETVG